MRGVGQGAVGVAVEVERAAVRVVPDPKCLVAEDNQLLAALRVGVQHLQLVIVFDPVERVFHAIGDAVMVAANEPNRAVNQIFSMSVWRLVTACRLFLPRGKA